MCKQCICKHMDFKWCFKMAIFEHKGSYVATAMKYCLKKIGCTEGI